MPGLEGTSLGRYRLKHRLAKGGMAEVYLAFDDRMHRDVAIKVVGSNNAEYTARFVREAQAMGKLHHDHILPAYDYGEQGSWNYLVMPYVAHGTLKDLLAKGSLSLEHAGELLQQIANGLQYAHQQGLLHRDIKPSNILLRDDHFAYLCDFGLARAQEGGSDLTQTGTLLGTPEYMAPELAEGPATVSSDVYALAVVLYSMVTGRVPFQGDTAISIFWKQLREYPVPPSRFNPAIPKAVDQVLMRALEKDPTLRYPTALALSQAFQAAISELETMPDLYETEVIKDKPELPARPAQPVGSLAQPEAPRQKPVQLETSARSGVQTPPPKPIQPPPPSAPTSFPIQGFDQTTDVMRQQADSPTVLSPRPRRLSYGRRVRLGIVIGLIFLFAVSGVLALLTISASQQNAANATATTRAGATNASTNNQTQQALGTQSAFATATAKVHGTATAVVATATAVSVNATAQAQATQTAADENAAAITSTTPIASDPLTQEDGNNWPNDGLTCGFTNNVYNAFAFGSNVLQSCISNKLRFGDAAIQVNTTLISGNNAGLVFRATADGNQLYDFEITSDGHFFLGYFHNNNNGNNNYTFLIPETANSAIQKKGNSNTLLVIAKGNDLQLFVNGKIVGEVHDNNLAIGNLGVVVSDNKSGNSTQAVFDSLNVYHV